MPAERLILLTTELFAHGGIQRVSRQAVAALAKHPGVDLEVWSLLDRSTVSEYPVPAGVRLRLAGGGRWRIGRWALRAAIGGGRERAVALMHLHLAPLAVPLLARGVPVGVFLHGVEAWRRLTVTERFVAIRAQLIANSRWTAEQFRKHNPSLADRPIDVCPLGVEVPSAAQSTVDDASNAALIVSRLMVEDRYKGHETLLRVWPDVLARVPSAELIVVGDGDDRSRLETLAGGLAGSAIRFVGSIGDDELSAAYSNCAFFVLPSDREGFGLVFLEAMRAGKACISGPGAPAELVQDGVSGYVVATNDAVRLTDALIRLFEDRELRARFGATGRTRVLQAFTLDRFETRFRQLMTTLASAERRAA